MTHGKSTLDEAPRADGRQGVVSPAAVTRDAVPGGSLVAAGHALVWLTVGNAVGLWLATLLLWPQAGPWLGGLTYGRWVPVHLNLQLYGWTSLPLIAWLFHLYRCEQGHHARRAAAAVWAWSAALACGAVFWLSGITSGKIFLDWKGGALTAFLVAQAWLWLMLAIGTAAAWQRGEKVVGRLAGLLALAAVPFVLWRAADPAVYPPVDPSTGGPTGVSLLGSTLAVVWILRMVPRTLLEKENPSSGRWQWWLWFGELVVFLLLEPLGGTHRDWWQIAALALLLPWIPLVARDWQAFRWPEGTRVWRRWSLWWWGALVLSGWISFLPGILDHLKFGSGLVAHSHLAMAGFTSSFCLLLLVLLAPGMCRVTSKTALPWNVAVIFHVAALAVAGLLEGGDQAWMNDTTAWRYACFGVRWCAGVAMLAVAVNWCYACHKETANRKPDP